MNYTEMQSLFGQSVNPFAATQWHGLLCGILCSGRPISVTLWHRIAIQFTEEELELDEDLRDTLEEYARLQRESMQSQEIQFNLVLPDDEQPMAIRAESLGQWCDAFLFGLAAGGVTQEMTAKGDSAELLQDMAEISRIEFDRDKADMEDELQFNELLEYIRVGVLLLHEEFGAVAKQQTKEH